MKKLQHDIPDEIIFQSGPAASGEKYPDEYPGAVAHAPASTPDPIEQEITRLMDLYAASLARYGATATRDRAIIQDGIQEAFLRYFGARAGGQQVDNPRAWLFKVLRNYILDCRRKDHSMPAIGLEAARQVADSRQDLESDYQQTERFRRALSALSPREQECVLLRLEGFGYEEIAEVLGIRSGTVAALLARALKKMRTGLSSEDNNP